MKTNRLSLINFVLLVVLLVAVVAVAVRQERLAARYDARYEWTKGEILLNVQWLNYLERPDVYPRPMARGTRLAAEDSEKPGSLAAGQPVAPEP